MRIRRIAPSGIGRRAPLLLGLLALLVAGPLVGQAQNEVPPEGDGPYARHPEAAKAIDRLKSPYCPGLMLEVCPSPGGMALRDSLETLADQGMNADQIVEWVIDRHGEKWRAMPKRQGAGLLAWLMPPFAVAAGIVLLLVALRRMRRQREEHPQPAPGEVSTEDEARLQEAMKELEEEEEVPFL